MALRLSLLLDRLRGSLFFVPSASVIAGLILAMAMVSIDDAIAPDADDLPLLVASTVDSARAILGTVATATITVAGIAFSVSLLVVQLASSQYSPRVVHNIFRDPTNKRVMGVVVGTFAYCLVVLQAVRGSVTDNGEDVVPNLSVLVALVLGVVSMLAIIAFINHNAHKMEVSELLQDATEHTLESARSAWPSPGDAPPPLPEPRPGGDGFVVTADDNGWVQSLDIDRLGAIPERGGVILLETDVGRYAVAGVPLAVVWPLPSDPDAVMLEVRRSIALGRTRTLAQDPVYGLRQIADVGIRALSPGIDDPTTAQDAIFHLTAVLRELHCRVPPPRVVQRDGRTLVRPERPSHGGVVELAFDELRRSAASHPTVCVYLLEAMHLLCRSAEPDPPAEATDALHAQARLVVEAARSSDLIDHDLALVVDAFESRFGG